MTQQQAARGTAVKIAPSILTADFGHLGEAVEAFEADPLAKEDFGEAMFKSFIDFKKGEWESYQNHVSAWEVDRYLKMF